ncbi:asparagine synthase (glutamine-hydrolyzing) [Akkermansiaceae bacterium]|nr:asparagine synthase (glutamine-hydrolyzing) [Akkermansiaceae bacterium]
MLGISCKTLNKKLFHESFKFLNKRGPDNQSIININESTALGHSRLSIIDLDESNNQPFVFKNIFLTYNGEIFNYIEIRNELISNGFSFSTEGDTEVVLKAFLFWGEECVNKFNGMWSFVIYDNNTDKFFCSRDRFGIKPFYYTITGDIFMFSSQIKPLLNYIPTLKNVNQNSVKSFYYKGVCNSLDETWFSEILRLPPAHNLRVNKNHSINLSRYWDYPKKRTNISFESAKEKIKEIFEDSVKIRMRSDVKLASTITSGLDSTSIVAACNNLKQEKVDTYTSYSDDVSFSGLERKVFSKDAELNEAKVVEKIRGELNINPMYVKLNFDNYLTNLKKVIYEMESPHSSTATVSAFNLYTEVKKKHKVLLEGQGGDEMLGGYIIDLLPVILKKYIVRFSLFKFVKTLFDYNKDYSLRFFFKAIFNSSIKSSWLVNYKMALLRANILTKEIDSLRLSRRNNHDDILINQHQNGLYNLLHYGDALSMANSVETRFPFLDYRLVEFCYKLPLEYFHFKSKGKYILREALKDLLPKEIYDSSIKLGFVTPIDAILKSDPEIKRILYDRSLSCNIFDHNELIFLLNRYYNDDFEHPTIIFKILSIKIWVEQFLTSEKSEL